jgi:glutathione S-transferase
MKNIVVTALQWAPPTFQGQVRDLAVRWALEEAGLKYQMRLVDDQERSLAAYRAKQPFGKIPVYEEDGLVIFESGAIVQHIAEQHGLLPRETQARASARAWMFAALNSIDPDVIALGDIDHFAAGEAWAKARRPDIERQIRTRLGAVSIALADRDYLVGEFSAADIIMTMVLRALRHTALVSEHPALNAWRDRCEARPAFQRALSGQLASFAAA